MKPTLAALLGALALIATPAAAALRVPQVVVNGGGLQSLFDSQGESINVGTDQQDLQRWQSIVSNNITFTIQVEVVQNAPGNSIGVYNASSAAPALYTMLPGVATSGWFAVASFRSAPTRLVVNLFDHNAVFQGSTTYLAGPPDKSDYGFFPQDECGTFYTQDARNPGGAAQALVLAGTGINAGSWWIAWEDQDANCGSDHDYDDCVLFLEYLSPGFPVAKSTWGALKARFR